ncbi:MAG: acyclic terpene utilization AtuA family protein [Thermoactinospora sp.]|nr:acyclic terpene utilization AtuA family protein [Thermoactinospora sp.]
MLRIGCFKGWAGFAPVDVLAAEWSVLSMELLAACLAARVRVLVDAAGTPRARCAETVKRIGGRAAYVSDGPAHPRPLAEALTRHMDVVVTGPVEEAAPAAAGIWHYGWRPGRLQELAGAAAAGLVLAESPAPLVVELLKDGTSTISKPDDAPGEVRAEEVRACLTGTFTTPGIVVDLAAVRVSQTGRDRVRLDPPAGRRPPPREERQMLIIDGAAYEVRV